MIKRVLRFLAILLIIMSTGVTKAEAAYELKGVDIMIICTHPGDEFLFLGGTLPQYVGEQTRSAVVVYLSSESEAQREQAKASLAVYGDRVQAVFGSFSYAYTSTEEEALKYWDIRELTTYIVRAIREYKPTIVLTHDKLGEYGHGAHCVAFDAVYQAVPFAAETGRYPESEADFGIWKVQRFFSHLYGENLVEIDRSKPLGNVGGLTALELDQQCYQSYERTYPIQITDGPGYTSAKYGLVFPENDNTLDTTAGDLFAGMDASTLYPTAILSATPAPTITIQAKNQATITHAPEITQAPTSPRSELMPNTSRILMIILGVFMLASFSLAFSLRKGKKTKMIFILLGCILASATVLYALLTQEEERTKEVSQTEPSALLSTQTPTQTATQSPVEAIPTQKPDPWDQYFRDASDPEEVVVIDLQNEHWEYRTDKLSILIDRIHTVRADGKPICYCVADIRMRGEDAFRAGVRNDNPKAQPGLEHAWHMARRYRAVLGIAGDNLIQAEPELKGILIRNGTIYSENQAQDTLAFIPQDMTMRVYKPNTITAQELLDQGILNTFSFGPILLNEGVRDLKSKRGGIGKENPRSGIGMVEPGHFIVITVDGRQKDYSYGMTIPEFAQLFYLYGCQIAYNLDGGSTTVMIFMGECLNQHSGVDSDVQRPMTDGLFWGYSELVPSVDDPVYNDGSKPWKMPPEA